MTDVRRRLAALERSITSAEPMEITVTVGVAGALRNLSDAAWRERFGTQSRNASVLVEVTA